MKKLKIAVVVSTKNSFNNRICEEIQRAGHTPILINLNHAYVDISPSTRGYDALYIKDEKGMQRITKSDIDVIIPRIGNSFQANLKKLKLLTDTMRIRSIQSPAGLENASDKYLCLQLCSKHKVRVPKTMYISSNENVESVLQKIKTFPVVVKYVRGSHGKGVFLVTKENARDKLKSLLANKSDLLIQDYIESGSQDYRVIVMGSRIVAIEKRTAASEAEFRANLSLGGIGTKATITPQQSELCIRAAAAIGLEVAGVDMIVGKDGLEYIIEINGNFGTKIESITGVNLARELVRYAIAKAEAPIARPDEIKVPAKSEQEPVFLFGRFLLSAITLVAGAFLGAKIINNKNCKC